VFSNEIPYLLMLYNKNCTEVWWTIEIEFLRNRLKSFRRWRTS